MQNQDQKIVERLRVRGSRGLQDTGMVETVPVERLAAHYPEVMPALQALKELVGQPEGSGTAMLPAPILMYMSEVQDHDDGATDNCLTLWFRCRLTPHPNGPLRGAMRDIRLMEERRTTKSVTLELLYEMETGLKMQLSSLRLDDVEGGSLLQASRLHFGGDLSLLWNFESTFFRPYRWGEQSIWPRTVIITSDRFLPRLSLGANTIEPYENVDDVPGLKEYMSLSLILGAVDDAIEEFLRRIIARDVEDIPYYYRIANKAKILEELRRFNLDELQDLVFNLGFEWEDLPGDTLKSKSRSLVQYFGKRKILSTLAKAILDEYPDADVWLT